MERDDNVSRRSCSRAKRPARILFLSRDKRNSCVSAPIKDLSFTSSFSPPPLSLAGPCPWALSTSGRAIARAEINEGKCTTCVITTREREHGLLRSPTLDDLIRIASHEGRWLYSSKIVQLKSVVRSKSEYNFKKSFEVFQNRMIDTKYQFRITTREMCGFVRPEPAASSGPN